jgi:hypothetical protein
LSESENKLTRSRKHVRKREQANKEYETCQKAINSQKGVGNMSESNK